MANFSTQELRTLRAALLRAIEWESTLGDSYKYMLGEESDHTALREVHAALREVQQWQRRFERLHTKVNTLIETATIKTISLP
jgi:hypothetical protein